MKQRRFLKGILAALGVLVVCIGIYLFGCWSTAGVYSVRGVPILNYHQVNDVNLSPLTMRTWDFEAQMQYLADNGYHTITMDQLNDFLEKGTALPDKPVLITFDDGYEDNYTNALPILKKFGMKATVFMIADSIGQPRFMNEEQLREMEASGITIESHTYSHKDLRTLSDADVKRELTLSKSILETALHHPIKYIAFPQGFSDKRIEAFTREAGYQLAVTVEAGNAKRSEDRYNIPRVAIFEGMNSYTSFTWRLHYIELIDATWELRDSLRDHGFTYLAEHVPLF
ncbi:MAG: polysaccharide deacetylase family protein [Veillonella sp.]|uniref:polysaccharide deacetylase family protein n=1 Tax=Veillonella sp. TaxID=1926307 RepID=UPI0025EDB68E|nr:polysaccharide deacetylase family protein [Veillonella sp.]MBS4912560.1 polysaccharide deacetylase family protein [Veillonella sp.]